MLFRSQGFTPQEFDTLNRMLLRLLDNCGQIWEEESLPEKAAAAAATP